MKILVTGGAGFIGANLCERLLSQGHRVLCLDNFYSSERRNIEEFLGNDNFELIEHDIIEGLPSNFPKVDEIYHLACPASPPRYQKDHVFTLRTCFEGTRNVLEFARSCGPGTKLLFSSTSEVYGDPLQHPQPEVYRGNVNTHGLRSCYDEGKRAAESLCMNYWRQFGVKVKIVRIFNTYGPKMDPEDGRVVSNFIMQALKGENLTVYGEGKQTRSFQYIDDMVDVLLKYMELEEDFPGPINTGNPNEFTILELAEKVLAEIGKKDGLGIVFKELPADDPMQRCPDISLAKERLGWEPQVQLEVGLKKTIEYFRSR